MWFRWHNGTVCDPKFAAIARKAQAGVGDVIAVWAAVLECASAQCDTGGERGRIDGLDTESLDILLGFDDGTTQKILDAMEAKGLVSDGLVSSWSKRQPLRERQDDDSAERVRAHRERKKAEALQDVSADVTPCNANDADVTPCNAMKRHVTPRVDKIRYREDIDKTRSKDLTSSSSTKLLKNKRVGGDSSTSAGVEKTRRRDDDADTPDVPSATFSDVMQMWNDHLATRGFAKVTRASSARQRAFKARVKEDAERRSLDWWLDLMRNIYRSNFLRENAQSNWLTIDWILKESNLTKLAEGKYLRSNGARSPYEDAAASDPDEILAEMFGRYDDDVIDVTPEEVRDG